MDTALELYSLQEQADTLGDGYTITGLDDQVYEMRTEGGLFGSDYESRIYQDDRGRWHAKVRFLEDDIEDAYDVFTEVAATIEEDYGTDLDTTVKEFDGQVRDRDRFTTSRGSVAISYNPEHDLDFDLSTKAKAVGAVTEFSGCTVLGAAVLGIPLAAVSGGIGVAVGAPMAKIIGTSAAVGGGSGLVSGILGGLAGADRAGDLIDERHEGKTRTLAETVDYFKRRKYVKGGELREKTFFDRLNEKNHLDRKLEVVDYLDEADTDRFRNLEDEELDAVFDEMTDIQFEQFERIQGLTVASKHDTYEEARTFAATVLGVDDVETDRPSLYEDLATFQELFSHLVYDEQQEDGSLEPALMEEGQQLLAEFAERDTIDDGIDDWLSREYGDLVEDHVVDSSLRGELA